MLSVMIYILLSVVMLNVIMLTVVMPSVVEPYYNVDFEKLS
jgi:hypothetical protein